MLAELEKADEKGGDLESRRAHTREEDDTAGSITSTTTNRDAEEERRRASHGVPVDEEAAVPAPTERARSQASSARSRPLSIVPRLKRRGILAQLTLIPEVERPFEYSRKDKWMITAFIALAACAAPMGSAIFYPALPSMAVDLAVTPTVVNLTVALYMLSMSIFPLWWSSFSETLGRRNIYISSFFLNVVFSLLGGLSVNIGMLVVFRVLSGGAAASVQAVGAGTIADIWEPRERGRAMGYFYLGPLMGPLIAPIVGGALTEGFGWRSTVWFLTVYGALVFILILFGVPETLPKRRHAAAAAAAAAAVASVLEPSQSEGLSRISTTRSVQTYTKHAATWMKRCFVDPLEVILYLRFPAVALTVYYAAITFGSLYVLNISIQSAFSREPYSYPAIIIGLLYIPSSLGYFVGSVLGGKWIDRIMVRAAEKAQRYDADGKLIYLPEDRMRENAWVSATLYPVALIWAGWTLQYGIHWTAPSVATFLFGFGSMLVFSAATTMLTEFMPRKSSSGVALNNFVRNIFSCTGGIVGQPLVDAMGIGWLMTTLGLIAWISGNFCIWLLRRNSQKWRAEMDKALN
ncbi:major facilitator superfamily transporter multidrug resistance [Durotheca rogersii]|uniref:major facilitator superfamily transporter multidrug resistance n=1 Tax=Durotheca rogersii TaxID=419775 RepID=UPI00221F2F30|nr:major facilitator superfamily transporter multidrug resistance [Durotheca rogersii]KAI5860254.1 major facilitator superfamily transporter multidrug resistance [Durotheca rogersii]